MIVTVTLNPSLDYTLHLGRLIPGATNRADREELTVGGKGINVSRVLAELDFPSTALGFAAGFTGEALIRALDFPGVTPDFIRLSGGLSRINVKLRGEEETEINGQGPAVTEDELEALARKLDALNDGGALVLAGSVPPGLPEETYFRLLDRVRDKSVLTVVDAAGPLLLHALPARPFLIKPNRQELSQLFGRELRAPAEIADGARRLQARGARNVLVSLGGEGALLLDEGGGLHRAGVVSGRAVNTVGSGDSMVAGFLAGFLQTGDPAHALRLGSACGMATAFSPGLASRPQIDRLYAQCTVRGI